jgi:hypothetical protein
MWVTDNVTENGEKGMRIHTAFSVSNMLNTPGFLAVYFETKAGDPIKSTNSKYSTKSGQLAAFREIKPGFNPAVYKDFNVFIPYSEIKLPAGVSQVKLDADLIYEDGELIQHLEFYEYTFRTAPAANPIVTFGSIRVEYDVTEDRKRGMRVFVTFNVKNMVDVESYLAVFFEKDNGDKLFTSNSTYRSPEGQTTAYRLLKPQFPSTDYKDLQVFIPYDEFNLTKGNHNLRAHADIVYPNGELIQHLGYYPFRYTKR